MLCLKSLLKKIKKRIEYIFDKEKREKQLKVLIRVRTNEELELRSRGLKEVRDVLNFLAISYFLSGGALLGALRGADFIKWDWDVEIDVKTEEVMPKKNKLIGDLEKAGFNIIKYCPSKINFKIGAEKYGTLYEIIGYYKMGNKRYRKLSYYPNSFVEKNSYILLRGEKFLTFGVPEKYLIWFYGDWKTPCRSAKREKYVTLLSRTKKMDRFRLKIISLLK